MAQKRAVRRTIKNLQKVKTWQLLILLILMVFISATFLRLNNVGMVQRRDAVMVADEQGNGEVTRNRVLDLQHHVSLHMNTGQNDVYLASQYERDRAALIQQAAQSSESGEVINQKVDAICKPQFSGYSQAYVECFAREYAKYSLVATPCLRSRCPIKISIDLCLRRLSGRQILPGLLSLAA